MSIKILKLLCNIVQSALIIILFLLGILASIFKSGVPLHLIIALMSLFLIINIIRVGFGINIYAFSKESRYHTSALVCQIIGLLCFIAMSNSFSLSYVFILLLSLVLLMFSRLQLWDLFVEVKSIELNAMRNMIILFFTIFLVSMFLFREITTYSIIISWIISSFIFGFIIIKNFHDKITLDTVREIDGKLFKFLMTISGNGGMENRSSLVKKTVFFTVILTAPVLGFLLIPYYIYFYIVRFFGETKQS